MQSDDSPVLMRFFLLQDIMVRNAKASGNAVADEAGPSWASSDALACLLESISVSGA